jgi:uncharacterized protein
MGRILLLLVALFILIWLVRSALAARKRGGAPQAPGPEQGELVRCAHCGVHLPRAESRSAGGRNYCSEEHWRLGPREDDS